jgi:hypothetical protein
VKKAFRTPIVARFARVEDEQQEPQLKMGNKFSAIDFPLLVPRRPAETLRQLPVGESAASKPERRVRSTGARWLVCLKS